jgi:FPC/CPF motif-containing protein YcgG
VSSNIELCPRTDLQELADAGVHLLNPDSGCTMEGIAPWFDRALRTFRAEVGHAEYPCHFGRRALKQQELFATHVEAMSFRPLADALSVFLDYVRPTPHRRQVLAAFVNVPGTNTHKGHGEVFWNILQYLHHADDLPWPPEFPLDPNDPGWEFCFHGTAMFVFSAAPTHLLRRSRNLGDVLVLLFQPRNVFCGIEGGTLAGTAARRRIRERLKSWDAAETHPAMGNFGDPSNFEWRQYVIPDDDSDMYRTCPLRPRTDAETNDYNRTRAREDETGMHDTEFELPELPDAENANAVVKAFAANTAFRAAEQHELTTEGNPFRRPVRPDDLAWLDYSTPMRVHNVLKLSGLLGNRMLRNIYDTDLLYLPPAADEAASTDGSAFYSTRNRVYAALAKPILERHLFTFLAGERQPLPTPELSSLKAQVREYYQRRVAEPGEAYRASMSTRGRQESATFMLLQYTAFTPACNAAVARAALGEYDWAHPKLRSILLDDYLDWVNAADQYTRLLHGAELTPTTAAYWQLYLNSSLARGNYLHFLADNHERLFGFLGAFLHKRIDEEIAQKRWAEVMADGLHTDITYFQRPSSFSEDTLDELLDTLVAPLVEEFGPCAVTEVHAGFADATWLNKLWDHDLATQLAWADRIDEYKDKADKLDQYITNENMDVDLDTFVESWEETSTTHVHDEHRLVMIEKGQMHFWNNITHKIELNTGDKVLIPTSRLHGSTVLSGECTYHQPIIPEEMLHQVV